jgi:hypothetical protein
VDDGPCETRRFGLSVAAVHSIRVVVIVDCNDVNEDDIGIRDLLN